MRKLGYNRVILITLSVALLSMVIGLAILSSVKTQLVRMSTNEYKTQQTLLANQIADTLRNNLESVQNQLNLMATMPEVKDLSNTDRCNAKLDELLKINQRQLGNLARVDTTGRFSCSVNKALIGQDSARFGSYVNDLIKDPKHNPVIGRVTRPPGTESLAAGIHVPVYEGNTFIGTLGGALYFDRYQDQYLKSIKLGENGHVVVMDDNGDILYHPSKDQNGQNLLSPAILSMFEPQDTMKNLVEQVKANKSGTFDSYVQGTQKVGLYKTIDVPVGTGRHWAVIVTVPVEDIENSINKAGINRIFIVLVSFFSLTTGLLTFISLRNTIKSLEVQRMKDEFISLTSHQLRTPATIVKQYLGLLQSGYATTKKEADNFINIAYESNETQLEIIENILSVSKLEAGHLEIHKEPVELQRIIRKIIDGIDVNLNSKNHKLQVRLPAKPVRLKADPTKLTMAIENLISNAIKYTPEGGKISVSAARRKGAVLIRIKDNGQGIPKKEMPKLFKRFNRMESAVASNVPGTGLGLYLTKKIVELHGGTIYVESQQDVGSTFTINLPTA